MTRFDPLRVLRTLNAHHVSYVLIGGYASSILGAPIVTNDVDVCYERTADNSNRLAAALQELHATLRVAGVEEDLPFVLDGHTLSAGDSFAFLTDAGPVDVLVTPSGTGGFKDLDADATSYDLGEGLVVRVVSLDDLIRMKEATGRPKDQVHLHVLAVLKEMVDQAEPGPAT